VTLVEPLTLVREAATAENRTAVARKAALAAVTALIEKICTTKESA